MRWLLWVFAIPKCINCKYFIGNVQPVFGKCAFFPYKDDLQETQYRYCSMVRRSENLCGKKGKYYVDLEKFNALY